MSSLKIEEILDKESWEETFNRIDSSNLLQSWPFGEAKYKCENWKARRYFIHKDDKTIGLFQVLEKSKFSFRVVRINRGPLFIKGLESSDIFQSFKLIHKMFSFFNGKILVFSPEDAPSQFNSFRQVRLNFPRWSSSWVDLSMSEEELKANLKQKWRNMLNKSNRSNISYKILSDITALSTTLKEYCKFTDQKKFTGVNPLLVEEYFNSRSDRNTLYVLKAFDEKEENEIASIVIATHGLSVTYLIGIATDTGRKLNATYFLLWNSFIEMKNKGYRSFDLGGIDEVNTPGVAKFKNGVNGRPYTLSHTRLLF